MCSNPGGLAACQKNRPHGMPVACPCLQNDAERTRTANFGLWNLCLSCGYSIYVASRGMPPPARSSFIGGLVKRYYRTVVLSFDEGLDLAALKYLNKCCKRGIILLIG